MGQILPEHRVSDAIYRVAAVARNLDCSPDEVSRLARARIRLDTGEWLLVHAAKLERGGQSMV
jgi:hypothetical protein